MKKNFLFVFLLSFMTVVLVGCQSKESNQPKDNNEVSEVYITKVSVSNSSGFDKINSDFFAIYEAKEALDIFENAISKSVRIQGFVDMIEPEFDLEVIDSDGSKQGYHLWLNEKGSTLMNVNDTHIIYSVSEEITTQLVDLIK